MAEKTSSLKLTFIAPSKSRRSREIDVLAVGEFLCDFISHEACDNLEKARDFHRYRGGSPANLAANLACLGNRTALIACVGNEGLGHFLKKQLKEAGVITDYIITDPIAPTSMVILTKTQGTPDFIAYRVADVMIKPEHISGNVIQRSSIYHTTCFALSREPAQSSILGGAGRASELGCHLSIDVNYAPSIWDNREEAQRIVAKYCSHGALTKISLDDISRLFDDSTLTAEEAISRFHNWGAELVCLTKGAKGSLVSWNHGANQEHVPGREVLVSDATGAGDAFWAGFLTAWLDGHQPPECILAGSNLAAFKLKTVGPLNSRIDKSAIYVSY
ncbi:MAG: carbohydrate kinase family protein [bacterium]